MATIPGSQSIHQQQPMFQHLEQEYQQHLYYSLLTQQQLQNNPLTSPTGHQSMFPSPAAMNGTFPTPGSYGVSMQPSTITCVSNAGSNVSNYSIMMMNAMSQQALASNNDPQTFQHQQGQDLSSSENTALVMQNNVANSNNAAPSNSRTDRNQEHNGG